ncbi:DUF2627 domain-containing protein [Sutcliffiella rhizosphaerae]|uniref:DUF2627 domain-containing protein n=1 Tax=Sutcliffiella rhizosphaerae TaxID=2880967 RepID=A0ABN8AFT5_9BACI|nr:DUF2627 domain-containing protein [Sutcliffiella rhizosphaerae]CAG9623216.1 hypothetical protein BACCIP111883_04012 [Sutcliffiella rhizosphaerae]
MQRIVALVILLIPGIIAVYGIKLMRDMVFNIGHPLIPSLTLQFIIGFLFFLVGLWFVAGFIFYRDRKRSKVQERFKKKEH